MLVLLKTIWFRFRIWGYTVVIIPLIVGGCNTMQKPSPQFPPLELREQFGKVGILSIPSPPRLNFKTFAKGMDTGAAKGAARGAAHGLLYTSQAGLELLFYPYLWPIAGIVVLSGAGIGAVAGSIFGAFDAIPEETAKIIEQELIETLSDANLSSSLADIVYSACNARPDLKKYNIIRLEASKSEDSVSYSEYTKLGVNTILQVKVIEAGFLGGEGKQPEIRVFMIVRTQVISVDNGAEIFERDFEYLSEAIPFDEWFADSAKKFKLEIDQVKKSLSGRIADEIFITTSFPFKDAPLKAMVGKPEYGSCWFYPINPKIQYKSFFNPFSHPGSGFNLLYTKIDSLQPSFQWESFPRPRDQIPENDSIVSQINDVTYDLQIWEAKNNIHERLICNRSDLNHPQYKLEFPLEPDTKYFWTFRARYTLNGNPQATRWAFSRHPQDGISRDNPCETDFIPYANYYRFITPSENQLNTGNIYAGTKLTDENEEGNLTIDKKSLELTPPEKQIKLAILPIHFYKGSVKYGGSIVDPSIESIGQALKANNNLFPTFSYYRLGDEFGTKLIDEDFISIKSSEELWVDNFFSPRTPNINLACEIGKSLGVDLVLLISVVGLSQYTYDVGYYLIDTVDHTVYKRSDKLSGSRFNSEIIIFTKQYFGSYDKANFTHSK